MDSLQQLSLFLDQNFKKSTILNDVILIVISRPTGPPTGYR